MLINYSGKNAILDRNFIKIPKPIIIHVNEIDEETTKKFFIEFQMALDSGQNIIPIIVESYGGDAYSAFGMADVIRNSPVTVMTVANGKACSAGAVILTCGHDGYRYASPNSSIMVHDVASGMEGKIEDMKSSMKEITRVNYQMYKILDENCGQKSGYFKDRIKKLKNLDFWISPERALEMNMINYIGLPNLTYNINFGFQLNDQKQEPEEKEI